MFLTAACRQVVASQSASSQRVRALVLKSTGTVFSSGHDFTEFTADRDPAFHREVLTLCTEVNLVLQVREAWRSGLK